MSVNPVIGLTDPSSVNVGDSINVYTQQNCKNNDARISSDNMKGLGWILVGVGSFFATISLINFVFVKK